MTKSNQDKVSLQSELEELFAYYDVSIPESDTSSNPTKTQIQKLLLTQMLDHFSISIVY